MGAHVCNFYLVANSPILFGLDKTKHSLFLEKEYKELLKGAKKRKKRRYGVIDRFYRAPVLSMNKFPSVSEIKNSTDSVTPVAMPFSIQSISAKSAIS